MSALSATWAHISDIFTQIEQVRSMAPQLQQVIAYIRTTWIDSTLWPPEAWSIYSRAVRTNNDVEG